MSRFKLYFIFIDDEDNVTELYVIPTDSGSFAVHVDYTNTNRSSILSGYISSNYKEIHFINLQNPHPYPRLQKKKNKTFIHRIKNLLKEIVSVLNIFGVDYEYKLDDLNIVFSAYDIIYG